MAINPATLGQIAYSVTNPAPAARLVVALPHIAYDWNSARFSTATAPQRDGTMQVTFTPNAAGDTIFLPYGQGEIHSVFLPSAGGPTCFMTAGMSGCKLFIDEVPGTDNLVVYHGNAGIGVGGGAAMNVETVPLVTALTALHTGAQAYWNAAPHNLGLNNVATFGRNVYNNAAVAEENRKAAQNRQQAAFYGGTTVVGQLVGTRWQFHWQTYGSCTYRRPGMAPKGWFGHRDVTVHDLNHKVLGYGMFYAG